MLGLGSGAAYAGLGLGLLLTYRASGILNLGYGTMALYPAYVYAELRMTGDLVLPGIPGSLHLGAPGAAVCLLVALAVAAALGALSYALVFNPLRRKGAPALASVVAAVGVHMVLELLISTRYGDTARLAPALLPRTTFAIAGARVPTDRIYLTAIVIVLAAIAAFLSQRTRLGLASRAMAEDEVATSLLGYSPVRLGAINWVIGSVVAGLFGILLAPIAGLSPNAFSFIIVPALATAVAGGFSSLGVTVGTGLALGIVQSEMTRTHLPVNWLGPQVLREVVPFVALAVAIAARGSVVPRRGVPRLPRLPEAHLPRHPARLVVAAMATGALAVTVTSGAYRSSVIVTMIGALLCLSLVVVTGFTGQISLAQLSLAGVAGFTLSRVTTDLHYPFLLAALAAAVAAGVCGLAFGLLALRARGVTFAVMTLGCALAVSELVFRNLSNGVLAANTVPAPSLAGVDFAAISDSGEPTARFGYLVLAVLAVAVAGVLWLRRSALARHMLAVRSNERAAASAGVDVARIKLTAFALSGFLAGLAGALMGYHQGVVSADSFTLGRSFVTLAAVYLGGIGSVVGALVAGLLVSGGVVPTALDAVFHIGRYQPLLSGAAIAVVAVRNPEGITGTLRDRRARRSSA